MPRRESPSELFRRWLLLVYIPLGTFIVCLALVVGRVLGGIFIWLVVLLGIYCVVPARLILETQRKGLELPKPPGKGGTASTRLEKAGPRAKQRPKQRPPQALRASKAAAVRTGDALDEESLEEPDESPSEAPRRLTSEAPRRRTAPAARTRSARTVSERVDRGRKPVKKSPQVMRRRALASVLGIVALLGIGGVLVVIGIGKVASSFGLVMMAVGCFLMILSVTLPTFRLVDAALRGIGRLVSRRPQPRGD